MSAPEERPDSALSAEAARVAPELYFLVAKFLSCGPLQDTAEVLRKELEEKKVLPERLDWEGRTHDQTFDELESQYPHVTARHLLEVCARLLQRGEREPRVSLLSRALAGRKPPPPPPHRSIVQRLLYRAEGRRPWHSASPGGAGAALVSPRLFTSVELQRRTLGHLSAVYCVVYDRTGHYIITGADDLLVKVWSALDGRLLMTCRGAASEITDVCVSRDNRLLCAGSLDRLIRVWELQSGAPIAVLQGESTDSCARWRQGADDLLVKVWSALDGRLLMTCRGAASEITDVCVSRDNRLLCAGSLDRLIRVWELQSGAPIAVLQGESTESCARWRQGADDLLVKVWSALDGRLLMTCRGAASEITDVCVSRDNRLLCAGSLDRLIRVWELQSGAPIAVLQGHSGMITSVRFCPARAGDLCCLVSTSTDGSVAFWTYSQSGQHSKPSFISKPVQYMERMRPGACHMICCCWSPGGAFLAAGSADHHVRVYMMAQEGPTRILEVAAHSDAVDSLAWCHRGLRFVSGSKDGTAILWQLHAMQWRRTALHMTTCLPGESWEGVEGKKVKVTMVCWDCSDQYIITAASDHTIKVWCARTCRLLRVLRGHSDEAYVLEAHPFLSSVLLSAGHDGQVIIWDLETGERLMKFLNHMEGQGHGAVFDAKWSPDGRQLAGTDSHGHLLLWGFGQGHPNLRQLPTELFFHTDYRPLVRDAAGGVLDEQTESPPHLMPPPFLVDVEGAPHAPRLQRLVPGRENLALSQLIPLTGEEGEGPRSHIDRMIALVLRDLGEMERAGEELLMGAVRNGVGGMGGGAGGGGGGGGGAGGGGAGTVWRGEGVRHTAGVWQRGEPLHNYDRRPLVAPLAPAHYDQLDAASEEMSQLEMSLYRREMRRRPQMISTAEAGAPSGPRRRAGRRAPPATARAAARAAPRAAAAPAPADDYDDGRYDYDEYDEDESSERGTAEESSDTSDSSVRLSGAEHQPSSDSSVARRRPGSSSSSDYSDWVADKPNIALAPPKRSKRKPIARKRYSPATTPSKRAAAAAAAGEAEAGAEGEAPAEGEAAGEARSETPPMPVELPEAYRPSEWLCAVAPRKAPYHPQMGDECYYFKQGHLAYLEAVSVKDVYKINSRDKPWERTHINECEVVKVVGVKYLLRPPRLVCLKLAALHEPHRTFTIKYHDMPDVIDFLVLRQQYEACVPRAWAAGDRFRCMIDDMWWTGAVVECLGAPGGGGAGGAGGAGGGGGRAGDAARHFLSLRVRWDNGEYERMSPWDLEPIDHQRLPTEVGGCTPVLASELEAVLYRPRPDEWPPDGDRARAARHIVRALDQVMGLSIAEPFVAPVDLNVYPSYAYIVEYPIDLSTIKARFENHFYRRVAAAQFDVRYLATNAEKFNQPHSHIVRQARIVTDLLLQIISSWRDVEVVSTYHALVEAYRSSDSDNAVPAPSTSRSRGGRRARGGGGRTTWSAECLQLMRELMSSADAVPFLQPVSEQQAPDYRRVVPCPMDLGTVRSRLEMGQYARAEHFARDARLVFSNSRLYNTNERSRIYAMTLRLGNLFEELYRRASRAWRVRRRAHPVEEYATSDEETLAARSRRRRTRRGAPPAPLRAATPPAAAAASSSAAAAPRLNGRRASDSWDSDAPLTSQGKGKGVGKKSKPGGSGAATHDEASTSRDATLSSAPSVRSLTHAHLIRAHTEAEEDAGDGSEGSGAAGGWEVRGGTATPEYEALEVLEEEVELTYEAGTPPTTPSPSPSPESSAGDTYRPPSRHRHSRGHKVRLKRSRKRRRSDTDTSRSPRRGSRTRRSTHSKRTKRKSVSERAVATMSSTSSSGEEPGEPAATRYESDHSYRPRLSSDDSAPLHMYRRSPTEEAAAVEGAAGPSGARRRPPRSRHHGRHPQGDGGRSRRTLPQTRYNEDSEEDSIAAISKRLREHHHPAHRVSRVTAAAGGGAAGAGGGGGAPHADHNYYNGRAARTPHTPNRAGAPSTAAAHHNGNGNTSEAGEEEPLSISSRGRVRKLTAKARHLLRD